MFYPIYWEGLNILKDALDLLLKETKEALDEYANALFILYNRAIQHLESIRVLTEAGLYGDAFAVSRNLTSDVSMIQYLKHKPELIQQFLTEKQETYQDKKNDFAENFSERAIHNTLTENGVQPFKTSFQLLSKASHASAFGSQLYGKYGKDGKYYLKYGPGYEDMKALALFGIISGGHYDLLDNILIYRSGKSDKRPPEWKPIEDGTIALGLKIDLFSEAATVTLNELKKNIDATEDSQPSKETDVKQGS